MLLNEGQPVDISCPQVYISHVNIGQDLEVHLGYGGRYPGDLVYRQMDWEQLENFISSVSSTEGLPDLGDTRQKVDIARTIKWVSSYTDQEPTWRSLVLLRSMVLLKR